MLDVFKFCKTREVKTPTRGTNEAAGIDFYIPTDLDEKIWDEKCKVTGIRPYCTFKNGLLHEITLAPGDSVLIPCGIHMTLPSGYCLQFENKSGIAAKKHLIVGSKICDSDFEGEVHINLHNVGNCNIIIAAGEKIIQGIIYKIELPLSLEYYTLEELYKDKKSERGTGGFGSTGTK